MVKSEKEREAYFKLLLMMLGYVLFEISGKQYANWGTIAELIGYLGLFLFFSCIIDIYHLATVRNDLKRETVEHIIRRRLKNMWKFLKKFRESRRAGMSVGSIVGLSIGAIVFAYLFPEIMTSIIGANITGWGTIVVTFFQTLFPILLIIGIAIKYIPRK